MNAKTLVTEDRDALIDAAADKIVKDLILLGSTVVEDKLQKDFLSQAVMASDFVIALFRFLERLLLVHGHWCYRRIAMMTCYLFYKNLTFGFMLFWYEAYASFSGKPAYNDWYMSCYNIFFTPLLLSLLESLIKTSLLAFVSLFGSFMHMPIWSL